LLIQSGGLFDATRLARECEISRQTVINYVAVLEATRVVHVIRPYSRRRVSEIVAIPKVYGFDTGFVCYYRGWNQLRDADLGPLWEHGVLNEIHSRTQSASVRYWRDKRGHEVDFVLLGRGGEPLSIECKWRAAAFDAGNLLAFRRQHPRGINWVVCQDVDRPFNHEIGGLAVEFLGIESLGDRLDRIAASTARRLPGRH
jgi:hypothetical protein